ncbi:MAG: carboxypeptidase-like regulatory domain-containing protein [Bacteroidota bacterium]
MSLRNLIFTLVMVGLFAPSVSGQGLVTLSGRVLDAETSSPLAYAYIHIGSLGTLSNNQGEFAIRLRETGTADTLEITLLGYQPVKSAWRALAPSLGDVAMKLAPFTLDEVEILPMEPRDTLKKLWRQRWESYGRTPNRLRGYYREHLREPEIQEEYFFGEGVLEIYKSGYPIRDLGDQVRVVKSRSKPQQRFIQEDTLIYTLPVITQGPHLGTELDLVRVKESFLKPSNLRAYDLGLVRNMELNDRLTYVFSFTPRDTNNPYALFEGELFIDAETLTLVRAAYHLTELAIYQINQIQEEVDLLKRTYTVNYRQADDFWVMQDAQVENVYEHRALKRELRSLMTLVITDIERENVKPFSISELTELNEAFATIAEKVSPDFWEDYNIMVPEDSLLNDQ